MTSIAEQAQAKNEQFGAHQPSLMYEAATYQDANYA